MSEQVRSLKPCPNPFCSDDTRTRFLKLQESGSGRKYVRCNGCGLDGPHKPTKAEAIAAWNHRPLEAENQSLKEDYERVMGYMISAKGPVLQSEEAVKNFRLENERLTGEVQRLKEQYEEARVMAHTLAGRINPILAKRDALAIENLRLQSQAIAVEDYVTVKSERDALLGKLRVAQEQIEDISQTAGSPGFSSSAKAAKIATIAMAALAAIDSHGI
jgi:hypothetical protein